VIDRKRDVRRSEPPYAEREFGASQSDHQEGAMTKPAGRDIVESLRSFAPVSGAPKLINEAADFIQSLSPAAPLAKETVEAAELMVKEIMENDSHWSFTGEEVLRVAQALLSLSKEGR
jgi:hypothetical protein